MAEIPLEPSLYEQTWATIPQPRSPSRAWLFETRPWKDTPSLTQMPFVDEKLEAMLRSGDVTTSWQLLGTYLMEVDWRLSLDPARNNALRDVKSAAYEKFQSTGEHRLQAMWYRFEVEFGRRFAHAAFHLALGYYLYHYAVEENLDPRPDGYFMPRLSVDQRKKFVAFIDAGLRGGVDGLPVEASAESFATFVIEEWDEISRVKPQPHRRDVLYDPPPPYPEEQFL